MSNDDKTWGYQFEKHKEIRAGKLLLSEPFMYDENFRRTVVLVCSHDEQNGTVGIILNKPINLRLNDVVEDFPPFKAKLFLGGPVATDTLQFLHSLGDEIEGSIKLSEHLYWGGNFEQLRNLVSAGKIKADDVHFYLGYSGWSAGQLLQEMKDNSWIIAKANYRHVFQSDTNLLWREVMKALGGIYSTMAGYPENPILN
ncbi:MAG: YqgE/AlgH family protein [Chitinophagales bacterium]|nr:YqgE/AlgH family protein [Chitinophagales bacterium]